jgi:hypothetical protein
MIPAVSELRTSSSPPNTETPLSPEYSEVEPIMANFAVNPDPYVPDGLKIEDWARPARGRIIISDNPPQQHEQYAIVTVHPPPPND